MRKVHKHNSNLSNMISEVSRSFSAIKNTNDYGRVVVESNGTNHSLINIVYDKESKSSSRSRTNGKK